MVDPVYLTVPSKYRRAVRKMYIRNSIQNIFRVFTKKQNNSDMIQGFKDRYKSGNLSFFYLDGAIDWYLNILYHCEADLSVVPNHKDVLALDLGCGAASVGYWLRNNDYKWSYIGVDIVKEAAAFFKTLKDARFINKNIEELHINDLPKQPDIIFAVNVSCYMSNIRSFIKNLRDISSENTKLIIIDGHPAPFWNNRTTAANYSTKEMTCMLEENNWQVERVFKLSIYNVANLPIMTISHGFLCSRS